MRIVIQCLFPTVFLMVSTSETCATKFSAFVLKSQLKMLKIYFTDLKLIFILQGYTDITYALQSNYSMRHIPFPTFDLQSVIKTHPERVDTIIHRMQELLQRNASPHRFRNTAQAFR